MADYGVTTSGFKRKRLIDIKADIEASIRTNIGNFVNLLPSTLFGQIIGIFAEREDKLWEIAEDVYNSQFINSSSGVPLQGVLALVGVTKLDAKNSLQKNLHLFGTPGTIVPVNTQVRVPGNPSATFATVSTVTLIAGQDQIQRIRFSDVPTSGQYRLRYINEDTALLDYDSTAQEVEDALNALTKLSGITVSGSYDTLQYFDITFGGDAGKTDHPNILVPVNTMTYGGGSVNLAWFTNPQTGIPQALVDAEALEPGPIPAPLYTLTEIVNPVAGLDRVLNVVDATVGNYVETDNDARVRSVTAQSASGRGSPDAIRARLLTVESVEEAKVFQNEDDVTDGNGLPPHSIRAYVQGGDDQDIFNMIWQSKGAGIKSDGTEVGTVLDTSGIYQTVKFSRPDTVPIFIEVDITKDSSYPADGDQQVALALAEYVNSLKIGDDVIVYPKMISALNDISGITDIVIKVGTSASPTTDDNIITDVQEIARVVDYETDIVVNS